MSSHDRALFAVALAANTMWIGGLYRLFGEAAARAIDLRPDVTYRDVLALAFALVLLVLIVLALLWLVGRSERRRAGERQARQNRAWPLLVITLLPAICLAVLLPGLLAATLVLLAGFVLRYVVLVVAVLSEDPVR